MARSKIALPSAIRAATNVTEDFRNDAASGVSVILDITAVPGTDTVTLTIQGKDPASGKYYTILAGAAQSGTGTTKMDVYPGLVVAANLAANAVLPSVWRISMTHSAASNFTYSVGVHELP